LSTSSRKTIVCGATAVHDSARAALIPLGIAADIFDVRTPTWRVAALLCGSGCCALVYQIAWLREFRLIFGASTAASAAVLAIFVGGLGLGGLLLGKRADAHPRPILLYAQLETIVALTAAASPVLLALVRQLYVSVGGTPRLGLVLGTAGRLVLSALVLAIPTTVMGGTLPAAARGVTRRRDTRRQDVAALYALNTIGAVIGCIVATFYMLEIFGTRTTLWLAAAVNLLIAMFARQIDRSEVYAEVSSPEHEVHARNPQPIAAFVLVASAAVGFAFFLMELVWYRMLGPLLGGSVFTFGLILAVALTGIGLGGLLYALVGSDKPASLSAFAASCLLEAVAIAVAYALGDRLAVLALVLTPLGQAGFTAHVAGWTLIAAIVVLPPALVAGYQFPLLVALFGRGREHVGQQVGQIYATNTIGAIAGSLAGGFGLLPWLSAPGAWRLVVVTLIGLGVWAAALSVRRGARRDLVPQLALTAIALALLTATGPTAAWRHSGIGAGRAAIVSIASPNQLRNWIGLTERGVAWGRDGVESSVALVMQPRGYAFIVNGKSDGSARGDAATQVVLGLVGAIVNPNARRALTIGLGTGSTAGWLGAIPAMERVDVVELEPLVVDVARACTPVNHDMLRNAKVHITIGDAREWLLTATNQYDVIASEPSNPFRAGVASLFTREYYRAAIDRLSADGVFVQWLQAYEIDARTLRTVYATMGSVFPHVETWQLGRSDFALVAAKRPLVYSAHALAARIGEEPFKTALGVAWRAIDLNGFLAHYLAGNALTRAIAGAGNVDVNTDDRNVVEFGFARSVGRGGSLIVNDVRQLASTLGAARPPLPDAAAVDWPAVETARVSFHASEGSGSDALSPPANRSQVETDEQGRRLALVDYYDHGNLAAARQHWPRAAVARDPTELAMLADLATDVAAGAGFAETEALAAIDRLRAVQPGEADVFLAALRVRQSRYEEAAVALESAFEGFRADPWALPPIKLKAMELASEVATRGPGASRRMFAALAEPFSLRALEDERLIARATLTPAIDLRGLCRDAVGRLEPHVPWTESFLSLRRGCYEASVDPHLGTATRDLLEFFAHEPLPLATGVIR
jgi:spermidine synthase